MTNKLNGQPSKEELLEWLRSKVAGAEKTLKAREEMAATWRIGSDAEWAMAGRMHPSTAGRTLSRPARLKEAQVHDRIAVRLRRELEMFRATLDTLTRSINQG